MLRIEARKGPSDRTRSVTRQRGPERVQLPRAEIIWIDRRIQAPILRNQARLYTHTNTPENIERPGIGKNKMRAYVGLPRKKGYAVTERVDENKCKMVQKMHD